MTLILNVTVTAKPGKAAEVWDHLNKVKKEADETEEGNLHYYPAQSTEDEHVIFIWEEYVDEEAYQTHRKNSAYTAFGTVRDDLVEKTTILRGRR